MGFEFDKQHIVVTGGAGSLGTATVELLLDSGAICSVPCLDEKEMNSFSLKDHTRVFARSGIDLTIEEQAQSFYQDAVGEQGSLWGSVHIAGGFGLGKIEQTSSSEFLKQFQLNTITCYNSCRAAVKWIRKSEYPGGRIVNIASRPALEPREGKGMTAYTVSKAGVAALTESLAAEVIAEDILVNAIAPSVIDTP
ncbi:MAG: SDR family NAD(P)-dependent oxidoreductase, partial [Balneolaceae bacterium]